jgi:hypothetical protein
MVIHIGIILAAGRSPSVPQPMPACNRMPAVLSLRDHFLRSDSSWRNGTVRRAKSPALTALTAPTPETSAFRPYASLERLPLPQRKPAEAAVWLASYGTKELSCAACWQCSHTKLKVRRGRKSEEEI